MAFRSPPAPELPVIVGNDQTGAAYTLVAADAGKVVRINNANANTVTVPANATVAFPVGTIIEIQQVGQGQTTIAAAGGVTLDTPTGVLRLDGQWATVALRKVAADEWSVDGRLDVTEVMAVSSQAGAAYTVALADAATLIRMTNAVANVVTVPTNATVAFPVGTVIEVQQYGAGQTSFAAAGGVTVRSPSNWVKIEKQYGIATLCKLAADEWSLEGRLSA